jgi:hypothetical protein
MISPKFKCLLGRSQNLNYSLSNVAISCNGDQSGISSTYTSTDHNGSQIFIPSAGQEQHLDQADNNTSGGLQLVHLLLGYAKAIDASEYERAGDLLCHLRVITSPQGDPSNELRSTSRNLLVIADGGTTTTTRTCQILNMIIIVTKPRIVILSGPRQTALVEMRRPLHAAGQQLQQP